MVRNQRHTVKLNPCTIKFTHSILEIQSKMKLLFLILTSISLAFGCGSAPQAETQEVVEQPTEMAQEPIIDSTDYMFPYDLEKPAETFELTTELQEISGLSFLPGNAKLVAIQDENGEFFIIDKQTGKVEQQFNFHKDGDYEGLEAVGSTIYVTKSKGTIYEVKNAATEAQEMVKHETEILSKVNDVEGLCHDKANNRLLMACKGVAGKGDDYFFQKCVYAYDLATNEIDPTPAYCVSMEAVQDYLGTNPSIRRLEKLLNFFDPAGENFAFSPSAIAIHPQSGNLYMTSSVGKLVLILSPDSKVIHIEKLEKEVHPQPEGLAFDTDGTLYISNEGKGGTPRLHRFEMK